VDRRFCLSALLVLVGACGKAPARQAAIRDSGTPIFGVGRAATLEDIRALDVDVLPDGSGLPPGGGTAAAGEQIFVARCAACHGARGEGASALPLVGGARRTLGYRVGRPPAGEPRPTLIDFYPYATTLFDYTRRAMPWNAPGSLSDDEAYSVVAWMLWRNNLVERSTVLDRNSLWRIEMPARAHFAYDPKAVPPR
jgi:cytochrome c